MAPKKEPSNGAPTRELMEWVAALTIVVALVLVAAQSFGFAEINDNRVRTVFAVGIILFGGPKAIRAVAEAIAEFLK